MLAAAAVLAAVAFSPGPQCPRFASRRALAVTAIDDPASVSYISENIGIISGGVSLVLFGGAFAAQQQKSDGAAPAPPPTAAAPSPAPKPQAPKPAPVKDTWGLKRKNGFRGGVNKPKPKTPKREVWKPPPGWTPPKKPVLSWYDKGERLTPPAPPPAPPAPAPPMNFFDQLKAMMSGGSTEAPVKDTWGMKRRNGFRGGVNKPKPKPKPREIWKPPPGWTPPSPPAPPPPPSVVSWYDAGKRL